MILYNILVENQRPKIEPGTDGAIERGSADMDVDEPTGGEAAQEDDNDGTNEEFDDLTFDELKSLLDNFKVRTVEISLHSQGHLFCPFPRIFPRPSKRISFST